MAFTLACCSHFSDVKTWNKEIKRLFQKDNINQALFAFLCMQQTGFYPDNFTFPILIQAATRPPHSHTRRRLGYALHAQAFKTGYSTHLYVQTSLLNMYSSFRDLHSAYKLFTHMHLKDIIAWNSMLDAYASNGHIQEATNLFHLAPSKDTTSFNIMISGYAKSGHPELSQTLFDAATGRDAASWNSIILACFLSGNIKKARRLFDKVTKKNTVTWNTMLTGILKAEQYAEVIKLFNQMTAENFKPDHVTISSVLAACAHLGAVETGRALHIYALENNLMFPEVTTSLIDLYAKCGNVKHFMEVFYKSQTKDIFCWNAVISGLALNGHGIAALKQFDVMKRGQSFRPDDITFVALLSGCSHSGLVQEGCSVFSSMKKHGISPKLEHYGCMVDLLGRANLLNQAYELMNTMPFKAGERILGALLSACVIHQNMEVGRNVVRLLTERGEDMSNGEYMMVSNLYATCGDWDEAAKWREKMKEEGIVKIAGCSVIELNGESHRFLAGDLV